MTLSSEECRELLQRLAVVETKIEALEHSLNSKIDVLVAVNSSSEKILKYVVFPLLIIVGALVGVKLVLP